MHCHVYRAVRAGQSSFLASLFASLCHGDERRRCRQTAIATSNAQETKFPCPFKDDKVWKQFWHRPKVFSMSMLDAQQSLQICQYFADAQNLRKVSGSRKGSYTEFPMADLARYFNVPSNSLYVKVTASTRYKKYVNISQMHKTFERFRVLAKVHIQSFQWLIWLVILTCQATRYT